MKKLVNKIISVLGVFMLLLTPLQVFAASGTVGYSATSMNIGESKDITIVLSNPNSVQGVGGEISSADSSCVKVNSLTAIKGDAFGTMFAYTTSDVIPNGTQIVKVNVTGLKQCTTKLTFTDTDVTGTDNKDYHATIAAADIKVGESTPTPSKSSNNNLSSLTVSKGSLSPTFNASTTSYQVEVENDVDSINVSATAQDTKAKVNGTGNKSLNVGSNTIDIVVTAEDGTPKTYKVIVVRKSAGGEGEGEGGTLDPTPEDNRSKDNTLKSLEIPGFTFEPGFDANNTAYTMTVGNDITKLDVNAIANDEKANISISGNTDLKVGVNNINITVTAENGSQRIYTVKVIRNNEGGNVPEEVASKSSENRLRALVAAEGAFTTNFDPNTNTYSMTVASDVNELSLTARPMDSRARVDIQNNGGFVAGETKVVSVIVTAEDGSQRIYTINVAKSDKEADTKLKDIKISGGSLDPKFDPDTSVYTVEVGSGTKSININATPANPNSKVEYSINGGAFTDNGTLDLEEGSNIVVVKITDENGLTRQYVINVEKDSSSFSLFGIKMPKWLGYVLLFLLLLLLLWLLFLLFKRRKKNEEEKVQYTQAMPNIEFKPEFNFGSKNQDNDKVEDGGILNQNSSHATASSEDNDKYDYDDDKTEVIPYDPYDEIVTKDEIIDAIEEKDPEKLKILYKQEMLNREKERIKAKEEAKKDRYEEARKDDDDIF